MKLIILFLVLLFTYLGYSSPLILVKRYDSQDSCEGDPSKCQNQFLIGSTILKTSTCLYFRNDPSIFTTNGSDITQIIYSDRKCTEIIGKEVYRLNDCNTLCRDYQQQTTQISLISDLDIPSSTIVHVSYGGECNKQFKNTFNRVDFEYINYCTNSNSISSLSTCNSTAQIINTFRGLNCNGTPTSTTVFPFIYDCDQDNNNNYIQFCNK